jgi:hypothetical protein
MPMSPVQVQVQALVTAKGQGLVQALVTAQVTALVTALEQVQGLARQWQARFGCCQLRHMR